MKIIAIGATGTIGREVVKLLSRNHEIIRAALIDADFQVDITSRTSLQELFKAVGPFDAVVSAAGMAKFGSLDELKEEDYVFGLTNKLMGQVNLVMVGRRHINDNGSFTLTSGVLSTEPIPGSSSVSMVNAAIEGFVRAAALELPRGIRLNAVSPIFVKETLVAMGMDSSKGMESSKVALAYKESIDSKRNGEIFDVRDFA